MVNVLLSVEGESGTREYFVRSLCCSAAYRTLAAFPFIVRTKPSDMRLGSVQRRKRYGMKESDARRLWSAQKFFRVPFCRLLARESAEKKGRYPYAEGNGPVPRSIEGWEEAFVVLYILLSLPLVSLVSDQCERRERESEQLNERNSSLSSCGFSDRSLLCCFAAEDKSA